MVSTTRTDLSGIGESDVLHAGVSDEDRRAIGRALDFAAGLYGDKLLGTGEPVYGHALGLARNVAELNVDADTRAAGVLFAAPAYLAESGEMLRSMFGATVATLVAGIGRVNELRVLTRTSKGSEIGRASCRERV